MRKLIIALLAVFALTACNHTAKAQITLYKSTSTYAGITTQASDTLTNANTTYFSTRAGDLNKYTTANYMVYMTINTISGTTAGTVIQQGSMDGTTWFNLGGIGGTNGVNCDSLTLASSYTNAVTSVWNISGGTKYGYGTLWGNSTPRVLYYRLKVVGSGTQSTRFYSVKLLPFTK